MSEINLINNISPIKWNEDHLLLLDQRLLPSKEVWVEIRSIEECHKAIKEMVVRGAPCIGFSAIFGMALWALRMNSTASAPAYNTYQSAALFLKSARPTAINLAYEVDRCVALVEKELSKSDRPLSYEGIYNRLVQFGLDEIKLSFNRNLFMAQTAAEELSRVCNRRALRLMTHCNTGYLACGTLGTALGVISYLNSQSRIEKVWVDETRPYMQGTRLTAYELGKQSIPHDIVVDGCASYLMSHNLVDAIFVGADRIVANGDTANKIGTSSLAVIAHHYKIPFYVVAPISSFDLSLETGKSIEIELRDETEILCSGERRVAPLGSTALNPSFDVTSSALITGIICEKGLIKPDYIKNISKILQES
ncbi:MAG: S-methyl-5-thioribose-1-phosphate isomerase [Oligoflexia bacterium]|nr:S-methyl-5-thioribose-1-phosphate isomerase [Oligoflexia bacterium]MBF0364780.1 S-methyl-5-thioribose-1-phosphate isomerase [Oligoflexia bacterium]